MYEFPISKVNYLKDEDWKKYGACYGADGEVFFPSNGRPSNESFKFCENCLVRPRCAVDGTISEALGIWGGLVGTEREKALETKQFRKKLSPLSTGYPHSTQIIPTIHTSLLY